jgi:hypothetical protein
MQPANGHVFEKSELKVMIISNFVKSFTAVFKNPGTCGGTPD